MQINPYSRIAWNLSLVLSVLTGSLGNHYWERPGCFLLGHTRLIEIPTCISFNVTTNACRGFCLSYAMPSSPNTLSHNPSQVMTSKAQCCNIDMTHNVKVTVNCIGGFRELIFKSARSCYCSACWQY